MRCLSLNTFWQYLSTSDVFPTHPSPSNTILYCCDIVNLGKMAFESPHNLVSSYQTMGPLVHTPTPVTALLWIYENRNVITWIHNRQFDSLRALAVFSRIPWTCNFTVPRVSFERSMHQCEWSTHADWISLVCAFLSWCLDQSHRQTLWSHSVWYDGACVRWQLQNRHHARKGHTVEGVVTFLCVLRCGCTRLDTIHNRVY